MCGIVGYVGVKQAAPILLAGLSKLEYRGYDSAGIAVRDENNEHVEVVKAKGRLKNLMEMTDSGNAVRGLCGHRSHPLGDSWRTQHRQRASAVYARKARGHRP